MASTKFYISFCEIFWCDQRKNDCKTCFHSILILPNFLLGLVKIPLSLHHVKLLGLKDNGLQIFILSMRSVVAEFVFHELLKRSNGHKRLWNSTLIVNIFVIFLDLFWWHLFLVSPIKFWWTNSNHNRRI